MWEMRSIEELNTWNASSARAHMPSTTNQKKHWEQLLRQAQKSIEIAATQDNSSVQLTYDNAYDCSSMGKFLSSRGYSCEIRGTKILIVKW